MLLRLIPPAPLPTILFTLSFPTLPQSLPLPAAWDAHLQLLADTQLASPPSLHALYKSVAWTALLDTVTFRLTFFTRTLYAAMAPYVEIPVLRDDIDGAELEDTVASPWQDPRDRQRELNDHLALIRILDDPAPFGAFAPFASEPALGSSKQRRQTLLNFVAFCLAHDRGTTVALASTIQPRASTSTSTSGNRLVLHVARCTGATASYERERAADFLCALKRAWKSQSYYHVQLVWGHVVQMTTPKLRGRLKKLRGAMHALQDGGGFAAAVDAWGREEGSQEVLRWRNTWHCESQAAALKDVFQQLLTLVDADDFDAPGLFTSAGCFRLTHSYFFPIAVLTCSQFLRDAEFGQTTLPPEVVRRIRELRRRCIKLRWYEIGVHLLCSYARDSVRRILGPESFSKFLCRDDDDALRIDWLETPNAVSDPMKRAYGTAQDALHGVLATISDDDDLDEPFACTIAHKPSALTEWSQSCTPVYHPELQIIDHLRCCGMRPSPTFIGCSKLVCRLCKFYVDQLHGTKWSLNSAGLDTMDLKVPREWLVPPTEAGVLAASIVREEAARLVLREDNVQRIAWEMRYATEAMGSDDPQPMTVESQGPVLDISS